MHIPETARAAPRYAVGDPREITKLGGSCFLDTAPPDLDQDGSRLDLRLLPGRAALLDWLPVVQRASTYAQFFDPAIVALALFALAEARS